MAAIIPLSHQVVKIPGQRLHAVADWNANHHITGNLDLGSYNLTTTGKGTFGELQVDDININGKVISSSGLTFTINPNAAHQFTFDGNFANTGSGGFAIRNTSLSHTYYEQSGGKGKHIFRSYHSGGGGVEPDFRINNMGASAHGQLWLDTSNTSEKNCYERFITSEKTWSMGIVGTTDDFVIAEALNLSSNNRLWITVGGVIHFGTRGTNYLSISPSGDVIFHGTSGLIFGSCYGNHFGWTQAAAVQNTWYNISDVAMVTGQLNDVTHDGNGKLTVGKTGKYKIDYSITWENNTANDHIDVGIEVDGSGSANAAGIVHEETKFANVDHALGGTCILDLIANQTIELAIRTVDNNNPTLVVDSLNLVCIQVGG